MNLAISVAGMDVPRAPRTARNAVTAASRATMATAPHHGNREIAASVSMGATTRSLSDSGSSHAPVRVLM